jgi:hypothetical protein
MNILWHSWERQEMPQAPISGLIFSFLNTFSSLAKRTPPAGVKNESYKAKANIKSVCGTKKVLPAF